jgi:hypothetical protein
MTYENPIVDEIRKIREEILAESGGEMSVYLDGMRRRTEEAAKAGRPVVSLEPRRAQQISAGRRQSWLILNRWGHAA